MANIVYTVVFPVTMYKCKSWAMENADIFKMTHLECGALGELRRYQGLSEKQINGL